MTSSNKAQQPESEQVRAVADAILAAHPSLQLATTGGEYSPWILGAYFAHEGPSLYLLLETSGKSLQNLKVDRRVAFSISDNDAMKDFVQGRGTIELMDAGEEPRVRAMLVNKMPWYKTFTPVTPVRVRVDELFVSSFERGWFPAQRIRLG